MRAKTALLSRLGTWLGCILNNDAGVQPGHDASAWSHSDSRRLVKYASVPTPTHKATAPLLSPSFRSFTTRTGCGAPFTYSRAVTPSTSILIFVHSPGTSSAYDSY